MADMNKGPAGFGTLTIDEGKVFVVRKKADGKYYRILADGREELHEPEPEAKKE
jgi:hypothetical protein